MVKCGRGPHFHKTVLDVQSCYNGEDVEEFPLTGPTKTIVADEPGATEKQIGFVCSLADQKETPTEASRIKALATEGHWGRRSISEEINRLKALPKRPAETTAGKATESPRDGQTPVDLEAGMYRLGEVIYKVQVAHHGSRHPYAKRLTETEECRECGYPSGYDHEPNDGHEFKAKWKFQYAPGAIRELQPEHRMTLEEAKEFGAIYGICCVCAAILTNEISIKEGIGPVCGGRV